MIVGSRYGRAAKDGIIDILKEATSRDCNGRDEQGMTPTLYAAFHGHLEPLRLLCGRGGDPDKADLFGNTALHLAAIQGHMRIVTFLVNFGANVFNTNIDGRTPQEVAGMNSSEDILRFLDGVTAKLEAGDKKKVKAMKEKAKENAKKIAKNYNKHKAKMEHTHEKMERRQTKDYRPSMINTIKSRLKSGSMSNLSNIPPDRRNTFSNLVGGGTVKGSKTMGTVQRRIMANKNNRLGGQNEEDFKISTIENGKASVSKLTGIRRDSEVIFGGTLQRSAFEPHQRGRLDGLFNEAEQVGNNPPTSPSNGLSRSVSQPDFLAELQNNADKPLQEPSSIFIRPGMGSIVIRKSLNSFGSFYQNASRPEESSIDSGESYTHRAMTDDELSDAESEEEEDSPNAPLERFLTAFGLCDYVPRFEEQKIDLETLLILTENDLKSLNLPIGPHRKLVNAINERKAALENPGEVTDSAL
ncbi:ankyrin repeat and SAM domain-containing protein 4B-like isoform X1 [Euwallacea similis]|uniref:ankyrin repeat and SAM domain-containing protein 4B-like isoform X1 n=1 Tax=Euwallacea similis TaxID=1736056 RepID=UPI00344D1A8A